MPGRTHAATTTLLLLFFCVSFFSRPKKNNHQLIINWLVMGTIFFSRPTIHSSIIIIIFVVLPRSVCVSCLFCFAFFVWCVFVFCSCHLVDYYYYSSSCVFQPMAGRQRRRFRPPRGRYRLRILLLYIIMCHIIEIIMIYY